MKSFAFSLRKRAPVRLCASVVAVFAAFPVLAQSQTAGTLGEVVVTANRSEQLLTDALPHTTVIARDVIERSQAVDLLNLLSREAGFQFTQNGGPGTSSNMFLRGSASLGVLVLIDGVPITKQDTSGTVSLQHMMLDQVERVEIVRGNVSAIYGSGAIGGVIQVFTRQGSGAPAGFAQIEAGSFGTTRAAVGISGQVDSTRFTLGVGMHRTDGFSAMNEVQYPNENPDADGYRNTNYSLALSREWAKGHSLGIRAQGSDGEFDFDGGGFGSTTDVYKGRSNSDTWSVFSRNQFADQWLSELTYSQQREESIYDARLTGFPNYSEAVSTNRIVNWTNTVGLGGWLVTAGAESQQQAIDTDDSSSTKLNRDRDVTAIFVGLSGNFGAHSLQVNVRQDDAEGLDAKTTGYLGYGFNLTPNWKLIANASTAFNLPPLGYLYDSFSGNPQLKPETARSREVGLQWAQGEQVVRATLFSTQISDLLLYDFATFSFNNVSDASNKGLEISYSGKAAAADLRASLTLQDPVNESNQQQLIRRAKTMASFSASVPWGAWKLGGDVRYTGERIDLPANPALEAYTLVNLTARYPLTNEVSLTARIDNLFDSQYQTAYGYDQSGRAVYVGVVWKQK